MTSLAPRTSASQARPSRVARAIPVLVLVSLMWLSEIADAVLPLDLDYFGIRPRELEGLPGIVLSPFLHLDFEHLAANTSALLVLGALVAWTTRYLPVVTAGVIVLGGLGVWLLSPPYTLVIGASGLVYGYAGFLVAYGFVARRPGASLVGILVALAYGSLVWGLLPAQPGVSWLGHVSGAAAGVALAVWLGRRDRPGQRPRLA